MKHHPINVFSKKRVFLEDFLGFLRGARPSKYNGKWISDRYKTNGLVTDTRHIGDKNKQVYILVTD